jgi:hypothetical protein
MENDELACIQSVQKELLNHQNSISSLPDNQLDRELSIIREKVVEYDEYCRDLIESFENILTDRERPPNPNVLISKDVDMDFQLESFIRWITTGNGILEQYILT